jgi:hypothetical protein
MKYTHTHTLPKSVITVIHGTMRNAYEILLEKLRRSDHLGGVDVDEMVTLKE